MRRISIILMLFFWILTMLACAESRPQELHAVEVQPAFSSSGSSQPNSEPSLSPREVLDQITSCVSGGDIYSAEEHMTQRLRNTRFGIDKDVFDVIDSFIWSRSHSASSELIGDNVSGLTARVVYQMHHPDEAGELILVDHFIFKQESGKWLLDQIDSESEYIQK